MKRIKISGKWANNRYVLVDNENFEYLNHWKWRILKQNQNYVGRTIWIPKKGIRILRMQTAIMNPPNKMQIDHINRNGLDNRKSNLRICTRSQNQANTSKRKNNTSGYKGVYWYYPTKKWMAAIQVNSKLKNLGYFKDKILAAKVYDKAAKYYFKDFALPNFS